MQLATVNVSIALGILLGGTPFAGSVTFELTGADVDPNNGVVVPQKQTVAVPSTGLATAALWPTVLGSYGTRYAVQVYAANGDLVLTGYAAIPNQACNLHDVITFTPAKVLTPTASAEAAQAAAVSANVYSLAAGAGAAAAAAFVMTATAQAALAVSSAQSAASVAQQDLSGVTSAAMHRSPNAVTALYVYNAANDSDGGAWTERVQHTSWYNEVLNGTWLPHQSPDGWQSELDARASGATLGAEVGLDPNFTGSSVAWAPGAGCSIANGKLTVATAGSVTAVTRADGTAITVSPYQVTVVVDSLTSGSLTVRLGNAATALRTINAPGTFVVTVVPTGAGSIIGMSAVGVTNAVISKFSVKPVTAFTTASGSYYQLATDGKFYRLSRNLFKNSVFSGTVTGGTNSYPTGWSVLGVNGAVCTLGAAETINGVSTGVVKLRRIAGNTGTSEGINHTLSTPLWATAFGVNVMVRVPTGTTAGDLATFDQGGTKVTLATAATLNAQPKDAWVAYPVTHNATASRTTIGFSVESAAAGAGCDIALPSIEVGAVTTYDATTATQETFRGNTAKFPKQTAIVAESASLTIYDLTQLGRPMWMRFTQNNATAPSSSLWRSGRAASSVAALNGVMCFALQQASGSDGADGLVRISFVADTIARANQFNAVAPPSASGIIGSVSQRNSIALGGFTTSIGALAGGNANAVAMTVLPNAPVDPVTNLQVPTIGVAVGTGNAGQVGTVLMNDGTAVNYSQTSQDGVSVSFTKRGEVAWGMSNGTGLFVVPLSASNVANVGVTAGSRIYGAAGTSLYVGAGIQRQSNQMRDGTIAVFGKNFETNKVGLIRENPASGASGVTATLTGTYNTGWMVGDIRRCLASDTATGTASGAELVTNGTFATDLASWTAANGAAWSAGVASLPTTSLSSIEQPLVTVPGRAYTVTATLGINLVFCGAWTGAGGSGVLNDTTGASSASARAVGATSFTFVATTTTSYVRFSASGAGAGSVDNVSVKEAVPDRSVKAKPAGVTGTLAMTAVASAAQLVAYSGFSGSNYIQEAYSADLDYGTAGLNLDAWVNYATATASTIAERAAASGASWSLTTDGTGKIVGTVFDGTSTRTVTSTIALNDSTWHHVRMGLTAAGTLTLWIDGVQNAQATGASLLTLTNASAVFTVGNNRALGAAFPGSIALVKTGATVPFAEQVAFMYAQERPLFQPGAQCCLADVGAVVAIDYDDMEDKVKVVTAANDASFIGLLRTSNGAVSAGAHTRAAMRSGWKLVARTTTNAGVDVSASSLNLREQLLKRAEDATTQAGRANGRVYDTDLVAATDVVLPVGWEASEVISAGVSKREGAAKDWTRVFDGFKETVRFTSGQTGWAQVVMRRAP